MYIHVNIYMKPDFISVHALRYKTEETRAFEVVFKDMKNKFCVILTVHRR